MQTVKILTLSDLIISYLDEIKNNRKACERAALSPLTDLLIEINNLDLPASKFNRLLLDVMTVTLLEVHKISESDNADGLQAQMRLQEIKNLISPLKEFVNKHLSLGVEDLPVIDQDFVKERLENLDESMKEVMSNLKHIVTEGDEIYEKIKKDLESKELKMPKEVVESLKSKLGIQ